MRKKVNTENLLEDEKIMPIEDNNCFGIHPLTATCSILNAAKLTKQDKINCGTIKCPFYKPRGMENSVKHIKDGKISFETFDELQKRTGVSLIRLEDIKDYEQFSHAGTEETERMYYDYIEKTRCFEIMTPTEMKTFLKRKGIEAGSLSKKEIVSLLNNIL